MTQPKTKGSPFVTLPEVMTPPEYLRYRIDGLSDSSVPLIQRHILASDLLAECYPSPINAISMEDRMALISVMLRPMSSKQSMDFLVDILLRADKKKVEQLDLSPSDLRFIWDRLTDKRNVQLARSLVKQPTPTPPRPATHAASVNCIMPSLTRPLTTTSILDYRSDTCSHPPQNMLEAMGNANDTKLNTSTEGLGDAVFDDDPTVHRLERMASTLMGKEAALFCVTGTMANLIAAMTHCGRGEEVISSDNYHMFRYEAGGISVLGSIVSQQVGVCADGSLSASHIKRVIKADDYHFSMSKLIAVENPTCGVVWPIEKMDEYRAIANERNMRIHLDGARIFNAAVHLGIQPSEICAKADSVMFCLSKGLCAPLGSMLCGSKEFITNAKRHWKMLGGGWRQAGVLATAGIIALDTMVERLKCDHTAAMQFAHRMNTFMKSLGYAEDVVDLSTVQTNIVNIHLPISIDARKLEARLKEKDILLLCGAKTRVVFHHGNSDEDAIVRLMDAMELAIGELAIGDDAGHLKPTSEET